MFCYVVLFLLLLIVIGESINLGVFTIYKSTKQTPKTGPTAQQLLDFFNAKVDAVRQSTGNCPAQTTLDSSPVVLDKFDECSRDEVRRTISSSQSKTCELDPLPTDVLKQSINQSEKYLTCPE